MIIVDIFHSERFQRLSKEAFCLVFGQAIAVIGSLIGVRVLTDLLTPTAYGELALGMTIATLVNQIVFGPLSNGIVRFFAPAQEQEDLEGYLKAVFRLVTAATLILVILCLLSVFGLMIAGQMKWLTIVIAVLIYANFSGYNSIISGIQNAARQRFIVALHQGLESWLRFLVAAFLMVWLGATSSMAMVGYFISVILVLGSQSFFFREIVPSSNVSPEEGKNWREYILKYSWPFATWGIFYWAQSASDRWALKIFASTEDVGMYAVLFQLGYSPMAMATGMAMQFLAPILYQRAGDASDSRRNADVNNLSWRLTWFALILTICASITVFIFHSQIFHIFVGKEYAPISHLLPWMLISGGVFAAGQTLSLSLMSKMETHIMMNAKIITSLLGVLFNFIGAYLFGISGIVFAGVLFSILYTIWIMVLSKRAITA